LKCNNGIARDKSCALQLKGLLYLTIDKKKEYEKVQRTDHIYRKKTNFFKGAAHRHINGRGNMERG